MPWQGWAYGLPKAKQTIKGKAKRAKALPPPKAASYRVVIPLQARRAGTRPLVLEGAIFSRCAICRFQIPNVHLREHQERCQQLLKEKNAARRKANVTPRLEIVDMPAPSNGALGLPDAMVTCEICLCRLHARNITRHLKRAHGTAPVQVLVARKGLTPRVATASEEVALIQTRKDAHDASKYGGHFAREHGRFGSMPSYDDFSDEGSPD